MFRIRYSNFPFTKTFPKQLTIEKKSPAADRVIELTRSPLGNFVGIGNASTTARRPLQSDLSNELGWHGTVARLAK